MRRSFTEEEKVAFGSYLKSLRVAHDLNQKLAAKKAGISTPYLAQIEQGKRPPPSREIVSRLAEAYMVAEKDILGAAGYSLEDGLDGSTGFNPRRIEWAFEAVCRDPDLKYGTWVLGQNPSLEMKALFVELYEKAMNRNILKQEEKIPIPTE